MGITIFTPTYNRAYTLQRLYESLCNQTCKAFEWLIVDDGSVDATGELIQSFIEEKKICIRYYFQSNAGKSMAHNKGVELADRELFVCVDSDDYLTVDAVEKIIQRWECVEEGTVGIVAKRKTKDNIDITKTTIEDNSYLILREAYRDKYLSGDTILIFDTSVIKKFSFPAFSDEKFVPEDYLYDKIGCVGNLNLLDEAIYICEYLPDGYTINMNRLIANNPNGYKEFVIQRLELEKSLFIRFLYLIRYEGISFVLGEGFILKRHFLGCIIAFLPGYVMYFKRFKKTRQKELMM